MADYVQRLIRWCFERFYREFAWTYDTIAATVSWGHWRRWALATLPFLNGDVLEIGCGTGNLQMALADQPAIVRVVGLDLSWPMIRLTRDKTGSAQLIQANAGRLPLASELFDCVVATFPSEYIADPATLSEVWRVLRPGGRLVILLGAQLAGPGWYRRLIASAYRIILPATPTVKVDAPASGSAVHLLTELAAARLHPNDRWVMAPGGSVYLIEARKHSAH